MTCRALLAFAAILLALLTAAPARADWVWPVSGEVITPYRNGDDPYAAGQHRGIDIAAGVGTTVVAAAGGEVRFAGTAGSSGLTVSIRTADGRFDTSYLHLSATAVRKGQVVAGGDPVGSVGTSGVRSAEQPHLHFGVRDAGSNHGYHDPLAFLPPPALAPERPRPAPAPSPTPEPLTPEPGRAPAARPKARPAPGPAPRRLPRPQGAPRRLPAGRGAPAPRPAPAPHGAPVPHRPRVPGDAPSPHGSPLPRRGPAPHGVPARSPIPGFGRHPGPLPSRAQPRSSGATDPARPAGDASGPDLGWALACLGLLAAAAILGLSEDGREATRRSRDRVAGVLRPLVGRR
jgi:hypothetical protein